MPNGLSTVVINYSLYVFCVCVAKYSQSFALKYLAGAKLNDHSIIVRRQYTFACTSYSSYIASNGNAV